MTPAARMKAVATGLLVAMAALLLASTWAMRSVHPGFVWVQAFAEAALVGGLADWFAVTALFRRPMGLPIPHTAIIPANKDRIGDALAAFIRDNFLTATVVARRLERFDAAGLLAGWLERSPGEGRFRRAFLALAEPLASGPAAEAVGRRLRDGAAARLRAMPVAPLLGRTLEAMLADGRHRPLVDGMARWAARTLDAQEGLIRAMVEERTAWFLRLLDLDDRVADAIVAGLRRLLAEVEADPDHPVRRRADEALETLAFDLKHLAETQAKVERWKAELMANPAVIEWLDGLAGEARAGLKALLEGDLPAELADAAARALRGDAQLAQAVNALARRGVVGVAARHGDAIVALVSDTVRGWDAATVTAKVEGAVSRDLQYIRLNGTLIGGLIGVALHALLTFA